MKRAAMLLGLFATAVMESVAADQPSTLLDEVRAACQADAQNLCPGVSVGGGRILSCLAQHKEAVSDACKQAVIKARPAQGQGWAVEGELDLVAAGAAAALRRGRVIAVSPSRPTSGMSSS